MTTFEMRTVEVTEEVTSHHSFGKFKEWLAVRFFKPTPFYGYGGPVETPFSNTIPGPVPPLNPDFFTEEWEPQGHAFGD